MQGGAWGGEPEKAKASLELLQIRCLPRAVSRAPPLSRYSRPTLTRLPAARPRVAALCCHAQFRQGGRGQHEGMDPKVAQGHEEGRLRHAQADVAGRDHGLFCWPVLLRAREREGRTGGARERKSEGGKEEEEGRGRREEESTPPLALLFPASVHACMRGCRCVLYSMRYVCVRAYVCVRMCVCVHV